MEKNWSHASSENLDRLSLQIMYFPFIRPILEYGDVICDNLSQGLKDQLDKAQNEAARIVTDYTKLVSIIDLY